MANLMLSLFRGIGRRLHTPQPNIAHENLVARSYTTKTLVIAQFHRDGSSRTNLCRDDKGLIVEPQITLLSPVRVRNFCDITWLGKVTMKSQRRVSALKTF